MKHKHTFLFIFSFFTICSFAQKKQDTLSYKTPKSYKLFIGADLIAPLTSIWDKVQGAELNANFRLYKKWHLALEFGQQKNNYSKINWDVDVKGTYYKVGANWSFKEMMYDTDDFFYAGIRYAFTSYHQEIKAYPFAFTDSKGNYRVQKVIRNLGEVPLTATWLEGVIGARKKLWKTGFFLDTSIRPKVLISSKKQDGITPLTLPGFGDNAHNMNISLSVSLSYKIPLFNKKKNSP